MSERISNLSKYTALAWLYGVGSHPNLTHTTYVYGAYFLFFIIFSAQWKSIGSSIVLDPIDFNCMDKNSLIFF